MTDIPPETVRHRRTICPPLWLEDYETNSFPLATSNPVVVEDTFSGTEGFAEMTPLHTRLPEDPYYLSQRDKTSFLRSREAVSGYQSTPNTYQCPPMVMDALHQLQEENRGLQMTVMEMKRQMDKSGMLPPPSILKHSAPQEQPREQCKPCVVPAEEVEDGNWPPPPPPIRFTDTIPEPPPVRKEEPAQPPGLLEELRERLNKLEMFMSSRPSSPYYYEPSEDHREPANPFPDQQGRPNRNPWFSTPQQKQEFTPLSSQEKIYRGPKPSIPKFTQDDPREFARLKVALENILPADATERFKYQVLCDHLKFEEALLIADSYSNSQYPYTATMTSLINQYGQPHHLSLRRLSELMDEPNIRQGDTAGFRKFALRVRALVGMLGQLGEDGRIELQCGSHVARLIRKLPQDLRATFRRFLYGRKDGIPSLLDFSHWLEHELLIQEGGDSLDRIEEGKQKSYRLKREQGRKSDSRVTTILHGTTMDIVPDSSTGEASSIRGQEGKNKAYCPYCCNNYHFLDQCSNFKHLTKDQKLMWIKSNNRCWRCGRQHMAAQCRLKVLCKTCKGKHLKALHEVNTKTVVKERAIGSATGGIVEAPTEVLYLDRRAGCNQVLLKISKVLLRNGDISLETYAILDDGSERTILLQEAAQSLKLQGHSEKLTLRTVRHDMRTLQGSSITFTISPVNQPSRTFTVGKAFTAAQLGLAEHSYPVDRLKKKFKHLKTVPLEPFTNVRPLLLIGSDHPHLITPVKPVRLGPPGGPAAVMTRLGWTLQGPVKYKQQQISPQQCLFLSTCSTDVELHSQVEKLWQLDILPYQSEKQVTRSRRDKEAVELLEAKTQRVEVDGIHRYATPLLRVKNMPTLKAAPEVVFPHLRATEKRLLKDTVKAEAYKAELRKLEESGYVMRVEPDVVKNSVESWFIPHHLVTHNEKNRVVFNCSFNYKDQNVNELLLTGPNLGPSLLGVLLRFREHSIAISSDIKGMFHQVRLLPEDRSLMRFLWRDLQRDSKPDIYEWQVLPFGTTCSPCCAIYALQRHVRDHSQDGAEISQVVERHFYVDNWLQSFRSVSEARMMVDTLKAVLSEGGFDLRQWTSNRSEVICHLPEEIRSKSNEQWLNHNDMEPQEPALGLRWMCLTDTLRYKSRMLKSYPTTMRNIYRVLASLYDPLGFLIPYTTRAKIIVQQLWDKKREWDDPLLPADLLTVWQTWEEELQHLDSICLPRCYVKAELDHTDSKQEVHIFCDASESAYGSVAYIRTEDTHGQIEVAFLTARSRVAPKRQLSMPRLELCAAVTGAQLARVLQNELTVTTDRVIMWTDSTTVLTWIKSDSCRYKVFVGTRIAEIQELTDLQAWRYVTSSENPADDLTRGKPLASLTRKSRWACGPSFLSTPPNQWPPNVIESINDNLDELRRVATCLLTTVTPDFVIPDAQQYNNFSDLVTMTAHRIHGAAAEVNGNPTVEHFKEAELRLLRTVQLESFPKEVQCLTTGLALPHNSRLITLAPEFDQDLQLIRVGGRLCRCSELELNTIHPVVLDPRHPITRLLIQQTDRELKHPGAERLFAELRRKYWILRGREAIKKEQRQCAECQKWRANPIVPKMSDLPSARVRLHKPAFFSTGMDCFGPFQVKVGRRTEKCWGLLFKCLTTRAVHIEVLTSINTDSFLLALRRFVSRRGKPMELLSDQGTNFKGGERELQEAFRAMCPSLQDQLATQQIQFSFNPPCAPHFGGDWEREIRSIKVALKASLGSQLVTSEVLSTTLTEIEGILNSKPLGYVSSDVATPDPVTPNLLLMGRLDPSLPQVLYHDTEVLGRRSWRVCQVLADRFWAQFLRHYLPTLQTRSKWQAETSPLQTNTVVMIVDPQLPRASWPVGEIIQVFPGADGFIRTAEVRVKDRTYIRPVSRLIRLPAIPKEDQQ